MNSSTHTLTIEDNDALLAAYMPFVLDGGFFVPTRRRYNLGDEVRVMLELFDLDQPVPIKGKVVWITPERAQGRRIAGIGVQINVSAGHRALLDDRLAVASGWEGPSHTM